MIHPTAIHLGVRSRKCFSKERRQQFRLDPMQVPLGSTRSNAYYAIGSRFAAFTRRACCFHDQVEFLHGDGADFC